MEIKIKQKTQLEAVLYSYLISHDNSPISVIKDNAVGFSFIINTIDDKKYLNIFAGDHSSGSLIHNNEDLMNNIRKYTRVIQDCECKVIMEDDTTSECNNLVRINTMYEAIELLYKFLNDKKSLKILYCVSVPIKSLDDPFKLILSVNKHHDGDTEFITFLPMKPIDIYRSLEGYTYEYNTDDDQMIQTIISDFRYNMEEAFLRCTKLSKEEISVMAYCNL